MRNNENLMYSCWLSHRGFKNSTYKDYLKNVVVKCHGELIDTALSEINRSILEDGSQNENCKDFSAISIYDDESKVEQNKCLILEYSSKYELKHDGYCIKHDENSDETECIRIQGISQNGILYGVFGLLRLIDCNSYDKDELIIENPKKDLRIINQWDNIDGTIERGYAGSSILYEGKRNRERTKSIMETIGIGANSQVIRESINDDYVLNENTKRIDEYGRLLCSIGINSIVINNTNVHKEETELIEEKIDIVQSLSNIFSKWGIKVFLSINFASPITLGYLDTSDPLNDDVKKWWKEKIEFIYEKVPDLGGFMVKADSEGRPGPFTYGRNHADGANLFAQLLKPYDGILIWRCFVYNCRQDWRDYKTDRAKAAYDCFNPLDGKFMDNVYLQIKNGPMDFQVREPLSPLFGTMDNTNKLMELEITQEYTGQQKHVCFLIPMWKEALKQSTYAHGKKSEAGERISGIAGIANIGNDENWTGHYLAQSNLYGFGRLCWNYDISSEQIIKEWIKQSLGNDEEVVKNTGFILRESWKTYEDYTSPLGIGWMVTPTVHYGPDVDGYEFSPWGTYNRADYRGIGIDRTVETGTGYSAQYNYPLSSIYEDVEKCPDELLLFFHHAPYTHRLKSDKTVIQHIYDTHFKGYENVEKFIEKWSELKGKVDEEIFEHVLNKLNIQLESAREWRDRINTYFYRMTGIIDSAGRKIY